MRYLRYLALVGIFMLTARYAKAQVSFDVGIGRGYGYVGAAPICSYGYYDYYPYECAPYGFYGPDYFVGGVFIGVGPWYRGGYYGRGGYGNYGRGNGYSGRGGGNYGLGNDHSGRGGYGHGGGNGRGSSGGNHGGGGSHGGGHGHR